MPIGNLMIETSGTWPTVLPTVAGMDLTRAFLAIMVLRPVVANHVATSSNLISKETAAAGTQVPA
uniref:hypothetical protein n=1 Tax=Cupriavidus necator TaxID=106590 RepID=UPI003F49AED2